MGLDTSHDAWHGAYSAFSRWRNAIAEAAGYSVWKVDMNNIPTETIMLDWGHITEANLFGLWPDPPHDPLIVLFAHSDCEGQIVPENAAPLADALAALLPKLEGDLGGHVGDIKHKTQLFIAGLRAAVEADEPLEFH